MIVLGLLSGGLCRWLEGWLLFLGATLGVASVLWGLRLAVGQRPHWLAAVCRLDGPLLVVVSVGLTLTAVESALAIAGRISPATELTLPKEWSMRPVVVPGAARAYYWHAKLHVFNASGFRNLGEYVRDENKLRIIVLGDSLTYGAGVAAEDTYPALLERILEGEGVTVRVYNLGVTGYQSEDIVRVARKWLPIVQPSRAIYGICLNDFLPAGKGQYQCDSPLQLPLPGAVLTRTRLGPIVQDSWSRALMRVGVCRDFFDDILGDFKDYQSRFERDLKELNRLVLAQTGRPTVAMVLDQYPQSERGHRIARIAEATARAAGMDVVSTDAYYAEYGDGHVKLHVSRWEGHPNEVAHRIFAEMFAKQLALKGSADRHPGASRE